MMIKQMVHTLKKEARVISCVSCMMRSRGELDYYELVLLLDGKRGYHVGYYDTVIL